MHDKPPTLLTAKMFLPHSHDDKVIMIVIIYSFYMVRELLLSPQGRIVRSSASVKMTCLLTKLRTLISLA